MILELVGFNIGMACHGVVFQSPLSQMLQLSPLNLHVLHGPHEPCACVQEDVVCLLMFLWTLATVVSIVSQLYWHHALSVCKFS